MTKRLKRLVFFFMMFVPFTAYGYSYKFCPPHETEINIDNQVTLDRLQYDYSKSVPELTQMAKRSRGHVFGLFKYGVGQGSAVNVDTMWQDKEYRNIADIKGKIDAISVNGKKLTKKEMADYLSKYDPKYVIGCPKKIIVDIVIVFASPTVHVAREFLEGTDVYNYVQWHENEHARITIENNNRYLPYFEQELRRYIDGLQFYIPETQDEWSDNITYIRGKVNYIIEREINRLNNYINEANGYFDFKEHQHDRWLGKEYEKVKEQ